MRICREQLNLWDGFLELGGSQGSLGVLGKLFCHASICSRKQRAFNYKQNPSLTDNDCEFLRDTVVVLLDLTYVLLL